MKREVAYKFSIDARVRSLSLRLALRTAMYRARCVSLPLRSAKRLLQAYSHKSTDCSSLPRFRNAQQTDARARRPQNPAVSAATHDSRCLPRPATCQVTPFPTPGTRNARCVDDSPRLPRDTHTEQRQNARAPHLRGSTLQYFPKCRHASGAPRLPSEMHVRHLLHTRIVHHSPRLPCETPTHGPAPRARCHARDTLRGSAQ